MAQQDKRLIPGDRLLSVNGIDLEHASLDRAVQVLKGVPKGKVTIVVAKPISSNDQNSPHNSSQVSKTAYFYTKKHINTYIITSYLHIRRYITYFSKSMNICNYNYLSTFTYIYLPYGVPQGRFLGLNCHFTCNFSNS